MRNHAKALYVAAIGALLSVATPAGAECTASEPHAPSLAKPAAFRPGAPSAPDSTDKWGYGYDTLLKDLAAWDRNPHVKLDSIGASVQGRGLWMLTLTEGEDSVGRSGEPGWRKRRIVVHARTHPAEVQAFQIAREMIEFLLDSNDVARELRRDFIWNIIPMYNPDGVELGRGRHNANAVDIESNWDKPSPEPEVLALRALFQSFMASPVPAEVALNLHSDQFNCTRFFFFHHAGGTSAAFAELEKEYIGKVQAHFEGGIEAWHFVTSWQTKPGLQYPEGFWWVNHKEKVMALTYEDSNCPGSGMYDSTAKALILGSADYLDARPASLRRIARPETRLLRERGGLRIHDAAGAGWTTWSLSDPKGRRLASGRFADGSAFVPGRAGAGRGPGASVLRLEGSRPESARNLLVPSL